jgi:glycosyltransferase 2 family protein
MNLRFDFVYGILSVLSVTAAWMMSAWNWGRVLKAFNYKLSFSDIFDIFFKTNLAKYLPGKVWQIASSTYMAAKLGIPEGVAFTASLAGQAYSVLSGLSLFIIALTFGFIKSPVNLQLYFKWTALPALIVLLVLAARPHLVERIMNWALRLMKREEVTIRISLKEAVELFALYTITWFLFGLSLWFLANALVKVEFSFCFSFTAILAVAVVIGFLALFTPGGLGVREGVIALFLSPIYILPTPLPSAIAVGFRIISVLVEVIAFGLAWILRWENPSKTDSKS